MNAKHITASNIDREKELQKAKDLCKLKQPAERESRSDDEHNKRANWKRGQKWDDSAKENMHEAIKNNIEEMMRCVSRNSRPNSQARGRPNSQMSRLGSTLPKKVAKKLENLKSPERDSPVLTPRIIHKEARDKVKYGNIGSRNQTPTPNEASTLINENYLKKNDKRVSNTKELPESLGNFEQTYTRKKQSEKIRKLLEKQKKNAEKTSSISYKGFVEKENPKEELRKKEEQKEEKKKEIIVKKAQVSKLQVELMNELLKIGETAVAQSKSKLMEKKYTGDKKPATTATFAVNDFEENQTLNGQSLSEELDTLFELKSVNVIFFKYECHHVILYSLCK